MEARIERLEAALYPLPAEPPVSLLAPAEIVEIIRFVAFQTGLRFAEIVGQSREQGPFRARAAVVWTCRRVLHFSFQQIGRRLGDRDHTTIKAALARADAMVITDPAFRLLTERARLAFTPKES